MAWVEWLDDPLRETRMEMLAERGQRDTAAVELLEENVDIAKVFILTRRQVITVGQGQPWDIDLQAVKIAMDLYGVTDQLQCLTMVRNLWHECEARRVERQDTEMVTG